MSFPTWGEKAKRKAVVEDTDLSFRREDFDHNAEFGDVEEEPSEECEDDGNVEGGKHCF